MPPILLAKNYKSERNSWLKIVLWNSWRSLSLSLRPPPSPDLASHVTTCHFQFGFHLPIPTSEAIVPKQHDVYIFASSPSSWNYTEELEMMALKYQRWWRKEDWLWVWQFAAAINANSEWGQWELKNDYILSFSGPMLVSVSTSFPPKISLQ